MLVFPDQLHIEMINNELIQGIEVVNDTTYSNEAFQLALDYDLTILGTSTYMILLIGNIESPRRSPPSYPRFAREKMKKL